MNTHDKTNNVLDFHVTDLRKSSEYPQLILIVTGTESIELFKKFCNRALNTWEEAPRELKALGDIVSHGIPLQDYNIEIQKPKRD